MTCLLIRQVVDDRIAKLEVLGRCNVVQISDAHLVRNGTAAALHLDLDIAANVPIQNRRKRDELRNKFTVDAQQNVAGCQLAGGGRIGDHLLDGQHAGLLRKCGASNALRIVGQAEPLEFVVRLALEHCLQRAAGHGIAMLQQRQRSLDAIQRQEKAACGRVIRAGVQRHDFTVDVHHRRSR